MEDGEETNELPTVEIVFKRRRRREAFNHFDLEAEIAGGTEPYILAALRMERRK